MARPNTGDSAKAPAAANTEITVSVASSPPENSTEPVASSGPAGTAAELHNGQSAPIQVADTTGSETAGVGASSTDAKPAVGDQLHDDLDADDKGELTIYPLRSYLDGKEIRRAGGEGYRSPKHDAASLIAAGLATDKNPKV